ncbi:MAG: DUF998 domain-containing protein [Dehalococcoidales bacterium]|nr:DUF998 domain-containing protein [Dehalococcoidales bacterium]
MATMQPTNLLCRPVAGKLSVSSILALAGMTGPLILVITDVAAGLNAPQYNFIRDSISSLAWTRLGWIQTIGFLALGLLVELFVAGLFFNIRGKKGFGFGLAVLVLFGFGLLLIGAFHTDPPSGAKTIEGAIHGLTAKAIFWFFPAASILIAPSLNADPFWRPLFKYSLAAAGIAVAMMISSIWLSEGNAWFGLFERILVADEIIWVEITGIWLLRFSLIRK